MLNIDEESTMDCNGKTWRALQTGVEEAAEVGGAARAHFDELKNMIQSLAAGVQTSSSAAAIAAAEATREQAATASAITIMGTDVKRVVTKVDVIEDEVGGTKKLLEKTNLRVEEAEEAIQEHAKNIQQMEEDLAKMNAGGTSERMTRRRKTMEHDAGGKDKGQRLPSFITLNGWVD